MIEWDQIDSRLAALDKDRRWLADKTPYSLESIRNAMAPASTRRSARMLSVLSRAIEDEEARNQAGEKAPGVFDLFLSDAALDRADRASRIAGAPSLADWCREVIDEAADELLAEDEAAGQRGRAEDATLLPDPADPLGGAGAASPGGSFPRASESGAA